MSFKFKKYLSHCIVISGFVVAALAYFSPVLQGKKLYQSDIMHYIGMAQQQKQFKATTGTETYWTNSAFGGMPTYQLGAKYPHNYIKKLDLGLRFLPRPADYLFLYFLGFYILLLSLKVDFKLAALGALAFGFSTYLIIILGVGHNSKAHAIAYMPLVLSGIIYTFRQKYILGFLITAIGLGLELVANHYQMTYYLLLLVLVLGIVYAIDAYKKKCLPSYFKAIAILIPAAILAVGLNATSILATKEYVKKSTRGEKTITINPDGSPKQETSGLDKAYITEYSYGILETLNLYIPRFLGGGSHEDVGRDSETYKAYLALGASPIQALEASKQAPTYWGDQPIVEAPAYIGAVVVFLFILGIFFVKGRLKWWLVAGTLLSLLLSYGKNVSFITDFFIDYVPLYNKFRAVSSIQVVLELCVPIMSVFALVQLFNGNKSIDEKKKALLFTFGITGGLALFFIAFKSVLFDFSGSNDGHYAEAYGASFIDAIKSDRITFFTQDTFRTLVFVILTSGTLYLFLKKTLSESKTLIILAFLIVVDLVGVDRRYVNSDDFVPAIQVDKPYSKRQVDNSILSDKSNFRVYDLVSRAPAKAAYFHNSLNGYHAAKLKRFNDVYEFYLSKNNRNVLNMFNTKYIIVPNEKEIPVPYQNEEANGNAWFISTLKPVKSDNDELLLLDSLNTKRVALIASNSNLKLQYIIDSLAAIKVIDYKPNYIKYLSENSRDGFAVFSEIYYKKGWQAYIDGNIQPHYRVNYLLRGMPISKGKHTIEFKFDPPVVKTGSKITLLSSIVMALIIVFAIYIYFIRSKPIQD